MLRSICMDRVEEHILKSICLDRVGEHMLRSILVSEGENPLLNYIYNHVLIN
jgi:hypothetical protein